MPLPQGSEAVVALAVGAGGSLSTVIDISTRRVPNPLTLSIVGTGVALAATGTSTVGVPGALGGFAVGLLLMLPGHLMGATGAGDVKLLAAFGTLLGPSGVFAAFLYAAIAGGVIALFVAARRRRLGGTVARTAELVRSAGANVTAIEHSAEDNRFAYAPAIALGALVVALGI